MSGAPHRAIFNPSLVRLALRRHNLGPFRPTLFNPSLVRLAPDTGSNRSEEEETFQSQLGSIGAAATLRQAVASLLFQSQLGSIGACLCGALPRWEVSFQSQLGSIGASGISGRGRVIIRFSIPAWFDWRQLYLSLGHIILPLFNPSLVRLAPETRSPSYAMRSTIFNPSLVRLALHLIPPLSRKIATFQSQLGSIGAGAAPRPIGPGSRLSIPAWFDWRW